MVFVMGAICRLVVKLKLSGTFEELNKVLPS